MAQRRCHGNSPFSLRDATDPVPGSVCPWALCPLWQHVCAEAVGTGKGKQPGVQLEAYPCILLVAVADECTQLMPGAPVPSEVVLYRFTTFPRRLGCGSLPHTVSKHRMLAKGWIWLSPLEMSGGWVRGCLIGSVEQQMEGS